MSEDNRYKRIFAGEICQIAGTISIVAGIVLSLHHWPVTAAIVGGAIVFYVGGYLRNRP